jgi:hypothetical protein
LVHLIAVRAWDFHDVDRKGKQCFEYKAPQKLLVRHLRAHWQFGAKTPNFKPTFALGQALAPQRLHTIKDQTD